MQTMHHGEVYAQQPMGIDESSQLSSPSALMMRRQRVQARKGLVPMPSLTMDTEDTRRVCREEDALDAPHYAMAWQEVRQRRLRKTAEKPVPSTHLRAHQTPDQLALRILLAIKQTPLFLPI